MANQHMIDTVYGRLQLLDTSLLPDGPILKRFVKVLQHDAKAVANAFKGNGHYLEAYELYDVCLDLSQKYLSRSAYDSDCGIMLAECCFEISKRAADDRIEAVWYIRGVEECRIGLSVDPNNVQVEVLPAIGMYDIMQRGDPNPSNWMLKIQTLRDLLSSLSQRAQRDPKIVKIRTSLGLQDLVVSDSESESSVLHEAGAVGGERVNTSGTKSKKSKKKKGKKKGRRSRQPQPTDAPPTRGAKKKRGRKKYKTICVVSREDDLAQDKVQTKERRSKSESVAELDNFDSPIEIGPDESDSSELDDSDSDKDKPQSTSKLQSTTKEEAEEEEEWRCRESAQQQGWEFVSYNKKNKSSYQRSTMSTSISPRTNRPTAHAVKHHQRHQLQRKQRPNTSTSSQQIGASIKLVEKLTARMKGCLDRLLANHRGRFTFLCNDCLNGEYPKMARKHESANHCNTAKRHPWNKSKVMVHLSESSGKAPVKVRPRPGSLTYKAHICWHIRSVCWAGDKCKFAHNEIERKVWDLGNVSHDVIVKQCAQVQADEGFCCTYCDKSFFDIKALEEHINTEDHKSKITSDNDRPWKYRDPPPNVINGVYALCPSAKDGMCHFSNMDPSENPCPKAHSEAELEEWQDRHSYRKMKMQKAKKQKLFSFMDELLAEYNFSMSESEIITEEEPEGVAVECKNPLTQRIDEAEHAKSQNNPSTITWNFSIRTSNEIQLKRVGLLHDTYRTHFYLSSPKNSQKPQTCPGGMIVHQKQDGNRYHINVIFESRMYGSFKQWVIFDFNTKPVLVRKLSVSIGKEYTPPESFTQSMTDSVSWESSKCNVIRYDISPNKEPRHLEARYKLSEFSADMNEDNLKLKASNYKHAMHHMLRLEEKEQQEKLASFNTQTNMWVTNSITTQSFSGSTTTYPPTQTQLFGQIDITQLVVYGDSEASQIALTSVRFVLLKFDPSSTTVYEAEIIHSEEGQVQTKEAIYVCLGSDCVLQERLNEHTNSPDPIPIGVQFRLDRLQFCKMHHAVDNLTNLDVVFPSKNKRPALICPVPSDDNENMNSRQQGAVRFIESTWSRQKGQNKPEVLLVYGPFGTGKTHTLANAVMQTLRATAEPRFLLCTHANPAADLYVTDFFDDFVKQSKGPIKMRRIFSMMRRITTISPKVRKYVVFDYTQSSDPQETPNPLCAADIKDCQIVITTTTTATALATLPQLKGHFTHILIDEAGQILETECIIPLALAGSGTCVVLAGDHLQMGPKVYSPIVRENHFHESLLERLFEFSMRKKCRREILLTSNYRTCAEILAFLSKNFYTAAEIEACGNQPEHPVWYPLEFRAVMGNDQVVGNSYINISEVLEVGNRVQQIIQQWPPNWGTISPKDIGILTPYRLQVHFLRKHLREQQLPGVFVGRLQAVQGKQFRVIIISTVRTLATVNCQMNDAQDYLGFLSESKELNTAFTRTQSLVVVIGNPLALCSIGECCNVWKRYIKECENNSSLYPKGVTYKDFQIRSLNPEAKSFIPAAARKTITPVPLKNTRAVPTSPVTFSYGALTARHLKTPFNIETLPHNLEESRLPAHDTDPLSNPIVHETSSEVSSSESDDDDSQLNKDDMILRELHRQLMLDRLGENDDQYSAIEEEEQEHEVSIEYQMIEEDGHVRLDKDNVGRRKDSTQPGETVSCTFRIGRDGRRYAVPKEPRDDFDEICISNNTHRGRALDGDDVSVQILENHDAVTEETAKIYGMVIDVEKSATDLRDKKIVCRADPFTDNLMVPIDRHLPKIYVLRAGSGKRNTQMKALNVRICRFRHRKAMCIREVKVSNSDRPHKLFLVKWLQWKRGHHYPLGMVTDELPPGDNLEDGLQILKQVYNVSECDTTINDEYPEDWVIPTEEINKRTDLRNSIIFTIDPPESQDLDDALSIEPLPKSKYEIGVHIADVGYFVRIDSKLDKEARARATTFYPSFSEPIHMLPLRLSTNLCSLLPDQDRLTLSVFFTMDQEGHLDDQSVRIEHSTIASCARFSYEEAEDIITGKSNETNDKIKTRIATLHYLAAQRRKQRLENERFSNEGTEDAMCHFRAHYLVEEMMLIANELVAKFLIKTYPECTPLRRQPYPDTEPVRDWQSSNSDNISNSISLSHRRDLLLRHCGDDMNVGADVGQSKPQIEPNTISITKTIWSEIISANNNDFIRLAGIISTDQHYPQLAPIRSSLHKILKPAEYVCSGTTTTRSHESLDVDVYTHFTSPIRRYIDIVINRQLSAAIFGNRTPKHDRQDVNSICHNCNIQSLKSREFELKARALHLALETMHQPIQTLAYIEEVSSRLLQVTFQPEILPALRNARVSYNLLMPIKSPEVEQGDRKVLMEWKERIYSLSGVQTLRAEDIHANQRQAKQCLDTHQRFTYQIPTNQWRTIQQAVATENLQTASRVIAEVDRTVLNYDATETVQEVTCEIATDDIAKDRKQFVKFQRHFAVGDVVAVQLHSSKAMGILSPSVQLLSITPSVDFCLEHRAQPVQCFTNVADQLASRKNIAEYKKTWTPIIEMEAAYSSIKENNTFIIHGIKIEWQFPKDKSLPCGSFSLTKTFCEARHIDYEEQSTFKHAWLCLRYKDLDVPVTSHKPEDIYVKTKAPRRTSQKTSKITFVAHASIPDVSVVTNKEDKTKERITIFFEVNHTSLATFPRNLVRPNRKDVKECSVEFIPYNFPSSRLRQVIENLDSVETPALIQDICLMKTIESDVQDKTMVVLKRLASTRNDFRIPGCKREPPNPSQAESIKKALSQKFTLIQGPPGTGKTITGAYLVYFFALHNQQLSSTGDQRPQVLYCGPSNKSVDVIAEYLKEFDLSIVRVYSKGIEYKEFPIPGLPKPTGKLESRDVEMDKRHKSISLHHLIRETSNSYSESIREYDKVFKTPGYRASRTERKAFKKLIRKAEAQELAKCQVILCTCNAAGSFRIQDRKNIIQCIVDEAGMCSEPETLIPLVATKPLQIVLIGDHKQLRPIIQEPTAKLLEMEISLLERYHKQVNMLKIQYRMHKAICDFPSKAFYEGKLVTPQVILERTSPLNQTIWPGTLPIAFCHSTGPEETLSVRTAEGGDMSKANPKEAEHVVRIADALVRRYGLKPSQIVILSQYRLQCSRILEGLADIGQTDISVRTVIQSQGSEWDFVIMSTVRSMPRVEIETNPNIGWRKKNLGFITDENQMNVALTRAKHGLIIVGNKFLLRTHKQWKALLEYYEDNNSLVNAGNFPKTTYRRKAASRPTRR